LLLLLHWFLWLLVLLILLLLWLLLQPMCACLKCNTCHLGLLLLLLQWDRHWHCLLLCAELLLQLLLVHADSSGDAQHQLVHEVICCA
jgi:hypothetical protein